MSSMSASFHSISVTTHQSELSNQLNKTMVAPDNRPPGRGREGSTKSFGGRGGRRSGGRGTPLPSSGRGRSNHGRGNTGNPPRTGSRSGAPSGGEPSKRRADRGNNKVRLAAEKLEAERKQKEADEAAAKKAIEEAEAKRLAEIERRKKLQSNYESKMKSYIATLDSYVGALKTKEKLRGQLDTSTADGAACAPLMEERQKFEQTKKSLKVRLLYVISSW